MSTVANLHDELEPRSLPASNRPRLWGQMRQQRLLRRLRHLGEQRAAMAVGRGDEASSHVIADSAAAHGIDALSRVIP